MSSRAVSLDAAAAGGALAGSSFVVAAGSAVWVVSNFQVAVRLLRAHLLDIGLPADSVLAALADLKAPLSGAAHQIEVAGFSASITRAPAIGLPA